MTVADLDRIGGAKQDDAAHPGRGQRPTGCFHCSGELERIFVFSDGMPSEALGGLHPKCVVLLGQILVKDGIIADMLVRGVDSAAVGVVPSLRLIR
jgi:hypothetical protein